MSDNDQFVIKVEYQLIIGGKHQKDKILLKRIYTIEEAEKLYNEYISNSFKKLKQEVGAHEQMYIIIMTMYPIKHPTKIIHKIRNITTL